MNKLIYYSVLVVSIGILLWGLHLHSIGKVFEAFLIYALSAIIAGTAGFKNQ